MIEPSKIPATSAAWALRSVIMLAELLPIIWLLGCVAYFLRAYFWLGRIPIAWVDDPAYYAHQNHFMRSVETLIWTIGVFAPVVYGGLILLVCWFLRLIVERDLATAMSKFERRMFRLSAMGVLGYLLFGVFGFFGWFLD